MSESTNIKQDILSLISHVDNRNVLELVYQILSGSSDKTALTARLSPEEVEELNQSILESDDESNLVSLDELKNNLGKWLKR